MITLSSIAPQLARYQELRRRVEAKDAPRFKFYGANAAMLESTEHQHMLAGPAECVAGETLLYDPVRDCSDKIEDVYRDGYAPTVLTLNGPVQAETPFIKGRASLYRIVLASGKSCLVTARHRVLTRQGWRFVADLCVGDAVLASDASRLPSSSELSLLGSREGVRRLMETVQDYQDDYSSGHHPGDAELLQAGVGVLASRPSRVDARGCIRDYQLAGVEASESEHSRPYQSFDRLSSLDCAPYPFAGHNLYGGSNVASETGGRYDDLCQSLPQSRLSDLRQSPFGGREQDYDSRLPLTRRLALSPHGVVHGARFVEGYLDSSRLFSRSEFLDTTEAPVDTVPALDVLALSESPKVYYTAQWDEITSIEYERTDVFYDLHVPGAEHYLADGIWHHNTGKTVACCEKLHRLCMAHPNTQAAIVRKTYMALWVETPIPTPNGWELMRDLLPGDSVFDENGLGCTVTGVSEITESGDCFDVVFSDGSVITTDGGHLWQTQTALARKYERRNIERRRANHLPSVVTTQEIAESLTWGGREEYNHAIQNCAPLQRPAADLPVDPYLLGLWLGDGTKRDGGFTTADSECIGAFESAGYTVKRVTSYGYYVGSGNELESRRRPNGTYGPDEASLKEQLRKLDLLSNKHIPRLYLNAAFDQRLALLQGLMDSDGSADKRGRCIFVNRNLDLVNGIYELIVSLGIKATATRYPYCIREHGDYYQVRFTSPLPAFRLTRKLVRQRMRKLKPCIGYRTVVDVRPRERVPVKCIEVDSPNHLYLAGASCIPTHNSMPGSVLQTFARVIEGAGVTVYGAAKPQWFDYPNKSRVWVGGMDHPEKVLSSERDAIYVNQAEELDLSDWETLRTRATGRAGHVPHPQVFGDCNPGVPTHWIKASASAGALPMLESRHEDNPTLFDPVTGEITAQGILSLSILDELTGPRKARLRYGQWAGAEGMVYEDSWDSARNIVDRFDIPADWPRSIVIDFGFTNPLCCQWYAEDPDGRLYLYREIYYTQRLVEDHARQAKQLSAGERIDVVICDHDAEGRATFEKHSGMTTTAAKKDVLEGIEAVAGRLRPAADNKARLFILRDSLVERDKSLADKHKPTCTAEEIEGYVWKVSKTPGRKEEPLKENDHGADAMRYRVAHADLNKRAVVVSPAAINRISPWVNR